MPVIHRVRVDFNIPGHSYSTTKTKREENPPYETSLEQRNKEVAALSCEISSDFLPCRVVTPGVYWGTFSEQTDMF